MRHAIDGVVNGLDEANHFVLAEHDTQRARLAAIRDLLDRPRDLQRHPVEKFQRADGLFDGRVRATGIEQMKLVGPNFLGAEELW